MTDIPSANGTGSSLSASAATGSTKDAASSKAAKTVRNIGAKVQDGAEKAASRISDKVNHATERTVEAYDQAARKARKVAETVDPFVRERPYAAIGAVLGVGVLIGMLLASRGPRVIYVKPRD